MDYWYVLRTYRDDFAKFLLEYKIQPIDFLWTDFGDFALLADYGTAGARPLRQRVPPRIPPPGPGLELHTARLDSIDKELKSVFFYLWRYFLPLENTWRAKSVLNITSPLGLKCRTRVLEIAELISLGLIRAENSEFGCTIRKNVSP